jgi:hypothetical protein
MSSADAGGPPGRGGLTGWLTPLVYLSNNWISLAGVIMVTTAVVLWLFFLPTTFAGAATHPYIGVMSFLLLPGLFFAGLFLIPLGIRVTKGKRRHAGTYPVAFPPVDLRNHEFRKLLAFVGVTTVANVLFGAIFTYRAVNYMDSVAFCGTTCHTVMQPEYTAYLNSPHSRVGCVACHIGSGASWFVRSKLSGVGQVFAVTFDTYPRPIPTPVRNLRPARETCEECHWPERFEGNRLRVFPSIAEDKDNTMTLTVLLMHIGGGGSRGIHGVHAGRGPMIEYAPAGEDRQTIPWVKYKDTVYLAADTKPEQVQNLPRRVMDCMDCHNRPTHTFRLPEPALDQEMAARRISRSLPFMKKVGLQALKRNYPNRSEAENTVATTIEDYYRQSYPDAYRQNHEEIVRSARGVVGIYARNVFPQMKVDWGTYPNNLGHMNFPGCFRCHDGTHASADGKTIPNDCGTCHNLLASDEASPKILIDLGVTPAEAVLQY